MALKRGGAVAPLDGTVEEVPDEIPRGRGGRPKIRALVDGVESQTHFTTYTRASTLGKTLESTFGLEQWKLRMVVHGLSRREDLVLAAAAIRTATEDEDKKALGDLAEAALEAAKATAGATKGTALHVLSEREDAGEDLSYLPALVREALAVYRRLMEPLEILGSEQFVVNDDLGAAGTFDRTGRLRAPARVVVKGDVVAELPAGTVLGVDLKTNKSADYFGATYASQQAVYFRGGRPYSHKGGRAPWPQGAEPSSTWSLILHVPLESLADAGFWWVDLSEGYQLAELATQVRAQTGRDDLFYPADLAPPVGGLIRGPVERLNALAEHPQVKLMGLIHLAPDEAALTALWEAHEADWTDEHSTAAKARLDALADYPVDPNCVECGGDGAPCCEPPTAVPAQVVKTGLMAALRQAPDEAALDALWQEHQDVFDDDHLRMVKVKIREFDEQAARALVASEVPA